MRRVLLAAFAALSVAAFSVLALAGAAGASERSVEHAKPGHGEVTCMAIGHCPDLRPPEWCDEAGNCEPRPRPPICEEGAESTEDCTKLPPECWVDEAGSIGCLPPWCDPEAGAEGCAPEPPLPPICDENSDPSTDFCVPPRPPICEEGAASTEDCVEPPHPPPLWCEDGSEVCVPPMPPWCEEVTNGFDTSYQCERPLPPWCDAAGNCEPPKCDPAETNPKFCRPFPDDPVVCVMGWPDEGPVPDCPWVYPPPICGSDEVTILPVPQGRPNSKFRPRPDLCEIPPPMCEPTDPGTTDPGEGDPGAVPGDEGESSPGESGDGDYDTTGSEDVTVGDPLPCIDPPVYGCFEDEAGNILCVDPPPACWEEEGREGLIACYAPGPGDSETTDGGDEVKKFKGRKAKAKARAKAKKAKAKAAKAKKAKAKAKAKGRR